MAAVEEKVHAYLDASDIARYKNASNQELEREFERTGKFGLIFSNISLYGEEQYSSDEENFDPKDSELAAKFVEEFNDRARRSREKRERVMHMSNLKDGTPSAWLYIAHQYRLLDERRKENGEPRLGFFAKVYERRLRGPYLKEQKMLREKRRAELARRKALADQSSEDEDEPSDDESSDDDDDKPIAHLLKCRRSSHNDSALAAKFLEEVNDRATQPKHKRQRIMHTHTSDFDPGDEEGFDPNPVTPDVIYTPGPKTTKNIPVYYISSSDSELE